MSFAGGVRTMTMFMRRALRDLGGHDVDIISLASSSRDSDSVRLLDPGTWVRRPTISPRAWSDVSFKHAGAIATEIEFQRYRPRRELSHLLATYDVVQFVLGTPPFVQVAAGVQKPILLWTATTTRWDRDARIRDQSFAHRLWSRLMLNAAVRIERTALRQPAHVFALSEYTEAAIRSIAPDVPVSAAPCGVDTNLFHPATSPGDYIVSVARFSDRRKNVRLLFDAYARLVQRQPEAPDLWLVGPEPEPKDVHYAGHLGIRDRVRLIDVQPTDKLAEIYRGASMFALSSDEEGLGIVILEAMASGLPVISTACGGPVTALKDSGAGILTPVGDVTALSEAMQRLVGSPALRAEMGHAARSRAVAHFSIEAAAQPFLRYYERYSDDSGGQVLVDRSS